MNKPRFRLSAHPARELGARAYCVVLVGTGKRTMWYGLEQDAWRAAFRGEFTRLA